MYGNSSRSYPTTEYAIVKIQKNTLCSGYNTKIYLSISKGISHVALSGLFLNF